MWVNGSSIEADFVLDNYFRERLYFVMNSVFIWTIGCLSLTFGFENFFWLILKFDIFVLLFRPEYKFSCILNLKKGSWKYPLFRFRLQKNVYQFSKDVSRISDQLERLSSRNDSQCSKPDGSQTCEKINTSYLNYAFEEEIRRLKDELQKTKSRKGKSCLLSSHDYW